MRHTRRITLLSAQTQSGVNSQSRRFQWSLRWTLAVAGVLLMAASLGAGIWRWTHPLPKLVEVERWVASGQWERADATIGQWVKRRPRDGEVLMLAARVAVRNQCVY